MILAGIPEAIPHGLITQQEMSMQANSQCSAPSSYLVFNTETGGWRVFPSKVKAQIVNRSGGHYRMFPVWEQGVDSKFLDFVHWAVAA